MTTHEMIVTIRSSGNECEAADTLANWMLDAFNGKCDACRDEAAHKLAVDMLQLVHPNLFDWQNKGGLI